MNENYLKISERIVEMTGIDIFKNTRKAEYVELRALACYIFREKMNMRWTNIANFFTSMGKKTDHASVIHLVKMYPTYAKYNTNLKEIESVFKFKDKLNYDEIDRINYLKNRNKKLEENNKKLKIEIKELKIEIKELKIKQPYNALSIKILKLFNNIPTDKIDEVIERIHLLKKSWSWKSQDKCEIIESGTSMNDMHW